MLGVSLSLGSHLMGTGGGDRTLPSICGSWVGAACMPAKHSMDASHCCPMEQEEPLRVHQSHNTRGQMPLSMGGRQLGIGPGATCSRNGFLRPENLQKDGMGRGGGTTGASQMVSDSNSFAQGMRWLQIPW